MKATPSFAHNHTRLGCAVQKHRMTIRKGRGDRWVICMYVSSLSCQRLFSSPMPEHETEEEVE
jgi:hypothetical protein